MFYHSPLSSAFVPLIVHINKLDLEDADENYVNILNIEIMQLGV